MSAAIEKLVSWAKAHGGALVEHPSSAWVRKPFDSARGHWTIRSPDWAGVSVAPFSDDYGVRWGKREVHYRAGRELGPIIHELGHVFACRFPPNHRMCIEPRFFGWEWVLSQELGLEKEWLASVQDYGLTYELYPYAGGGTDFYNAEDAGEAWIVFDNAVKLGKRYGNLNEYGEPVSVRRAR